MRALTGVSQKKFAQLLPIGAITKQDGVLTTQDTPFIIPLEVDSYSGLRDAHFGTLAEGWRGNSYLSAGSNNWVIIPSQNFVYADQSGNIGYQATSRIPIRTQPGYRAQPITVLLAKADHLTIEDMRQIQGDTYSLFAEALRPYLLTVQPENELQAQALAE